MAKKKATKVPEGITSKKTPTGINVTISENGRIIAVLRGYNNTRNVQKGLAALYSALRKALRCDDLDAVPAKFYFDLNGDSPRKLNRGPRKGEVAPPPITTPKKKTAKKK